MKNNKFGDKIAFSGLFAAIGFLCCMLNYDITADTPGGCVLWSVEACAVSLVMGCLGFEFSLWLKRKKFKVMGRRNIALSLAIALLAGMVIGAVGQLLYALEITTKSNDTEKNESNVVFLLDWSNSMKYQRLSCMDAICKTLDDMDENIYFQYVPFSSCDIDKQNHATDFLPVTNSNRSYFKDKIQNTYIEFMANNFNMALDFAVNTILENNYDSRRNIIVMFSDCAGEVNLNITDDFSAYGIEFYILSIENEEALTVGDDSRQLLDISDENYKIDCGVSGVQGAKVDDMADALDQILAEPETGEKPERETKLTLGRELLLGESEFSFWRVVVRIIFFSLMSGVASYIYYGFEDHKKLLINFAFGAVAALLSFVFYPLGIILLIFLGLGGFTEYEVEGEQ